MKPVHKQFILLTGPPGVGKTTLVKNVSKILHEKSYELSGFYTEEIRENGGRIGFDIVLLNGRRGPLARLRNGDSHRGPKVGKYIVDVNSFESICLPLFTELGKNKILVLDEIGKMELFSEKFKSKIVQWFSNGEHIILGTVPVKGPNPIFLVEKIKSHPYSLLISIDRTNRNFLADEIVACVIEAAASMQNRSK